MQTRCSLVAPEDSRMSRNGLSQVFTEASVTQFTKTRASKGSVVLLAAQEKLPANSASLVGTHGHGLRVATTVLPARPGQREPAGPGGPLLGSTDGSARTLFCFRAAAAASSPDSGGATGAERRYPRPGDPHPPRGGRRSR